MKRFLFCAAAAIVALASCSKTEVVNTSAPQEIGFKAVTGAMTKANATIGDQAFNNMGVFAVDDQSTLYLENVKFVYKQAVDYWGGVTPQYWPLSGNLDFAVYAPHTAGVTFNQSNSVLTIAVDNSSSQTDWLYGEAMLSDKTKNNTAMAVNLRHALAKVTVNVSSDLDGLVITSLTVNNTKQTETLTVNYSTTDDNLTDGDSRFTWTDTGNEVSKTLFTNHTFNGAEKSGNCYVIPSEQTSITMNYKLAADSQELTYTHDLSGSGNWIEGKSYVYNINITSNEIKFAPTVTDWGTPVTADDINTDPNSATPVANN